MPSIYCKSTFCCRVSLVLALFASVLSIGLLSTSSSAADRELTGKQWIDMDYGPYLTGSIQVAPGNIAYKGLAIRLDEGTGGVSAGNQFVLFDKDTLRYAAAWSGDEFIDWRSIVFDGSHGTHPSIRGNVVLANPVGPGWGGPGDNRFTEERLRGHDKLPYGPLDRDWAHWKGLYRHGDSVVLSYTVGSADVLETPALETHGDLTAFSRTLSIGPRKSDLVLQVAHDPTAKIRLVGVDHPGSPNKQIALFERPVAAKSPDATEPVGSAAFDGKTSFAIAGSEAFDLTNADYTVVARIRTKNDGTILSKASTGGAWAPNGKTFFIRGGRLSFDIGWVGAVTGQRKVADGRPHEVALSYEHASGTVRLYVDGKLDKEETLKPKGRAKNQTVRLGFTSPNFPETSALRGKLNDVRFFQRKLSDDEIANVGSKTNDKTLVASWTLTEPKGLRDSSANKHHAHRVAATQAVAADNAEPSDSGLLTIAATVGGPKGTKWFTTDDGHLRLLIPAGNSPVRLKLLVSQVASIKEAKPFAALVRASSQPTDPATLTKGNPTRWPERLKTEPSILGPKDGPLVVEVVTAPMDNPYRSWMRLGGFDFFKDNTKAAVCTWMGDVWIVEGLGEKFGPFTWRRIASGMFQPLGLKIVDEKIYVTCRDQITRLHDFNGDGEIDYYENFNNDHQVTEHFHEFAMDLQTDAEGNFYYAKSARHAKDSLVPHHGTLIKVSKEGHKSEIVCNGFRAANGVGIGPNGELATSDQEGHWTPANRINLVKPGGFYGNMYSYHVGERPTDYIPPLCWLPKGVDRSPAAALWVNSERWGPLNGKMLSTSYGTGKVWAVMHETVEGVVQGGVVQLPLPLFPTGIMRGRFHPEDGQLYTCGLFGWSSNRTQPGGLYRVRYSGKPLDMPVGLKVTPIGIDITFSRPLDKKAAIDIDNYAIEQWNYRWSGNYGSPHFSVLNPKKQGQDEAEVYEITLSDDGKTVHIELEEVEPVMQMEISYTLTTADGRELRQTIYNTINVVPEE